MGIAFDCPQCGKGFDVSPAAAGRKARCKRCGVLLQVPKRNGLPAIVFAEAVEEEEPPPPPARPAPQRRPKASPPPAPGVDRFGLDEKADAPGFEVIDDALPPQRTRWSEPEPGGVPLALKLAMGVVSVLALGLLIGLVFFRSGPEPNPPAPVADANTNANDAEGETTAESATAAAPTPKEGAGQTEPPPAPSNRPELPPRGTGREMEGGVEFQEVLIGSGHSRPGQPPGHGMTLWLYLPSGEHKPKSLPCILIAPAGSIQVTGNELSNGQGDHPEHLPWVRAGFAVLAYGLDGEVSDPNTAPPAELRQAMASFRSARAGLTNADIALAWLTARVPEVDPNRIYAVGHSSAATTALLLAEHDPRIKGVVAFAPGADVAANFDEPQKKALRAIAPWLDEYFTLYNPMNHTNELNVPLFLFHARDDNVVPVATTETLARMVEPHNRRVTVALVNTGGHFNSMINQGIPRAIQWLRSVDQGR